MPSKGKAKARKKRQKQKAHDREKQLKSQLKEYQETITKKERVLASVNRYNIG